VTPKVLSNVKSSAQNPSDLDGYDDLKPEDKEKVNKAWEEGKIAEEDITESAKEPKGDGDGKTKGKRARANRVAEDGATHPAGNLLRTINIAATDEGTMRPFPSSDGHGLPPPSPPPASTSRDSGSSAIQSNRKRSASPPPGSISRSGGIPNRSALSLPNTIMESSPLEYIVDVKTRSYYRRQAREVFQRLEYDRSDAQIIYVMELLQNDKNAETFVDFIRDSLRRAWVRKKIAEAGLE
jgi:hypothetical protein